MFSPLYVYLVHYLKENKLTKPGCQQFQSFIVWFIRSVGSFQLMSDIYVTNRFEQKLMGRIATAHKSPPTTT